MAKRANPYTDDYVPQSKIHVSLKQFNNNEDRLQKVYERTLKLLFKGANKSQTEDVIGDKNNEITATDKKNNMKQLFIGKNGALMHYGNIVKNKASAKQCKCGSEGESQCAYCELALCSTCQHLCSCCERAYCASCMLLGLEGAETCVSCYS